MLISVVFLALLIISRVDLILDTAGLDVFGYAHIMVNFPQVPIEKLPINQRRVFGVKRIPCSVGSAVKNSKHIVAVIDIPTGAQHAF